MRIAIWLALALAAGCELPRTLRAPEPVFPRVPTYTSQIVELRTTLARAGIRLDLRGTAEHEVWSWQCDPEAPAAGCTRCELAGPDDALDLGAIDALTEAFDRYPTPVLAAADIEHVALCTKLERVGRSTGDGLAGSADPDAHRMMINVDSFLGVGYDPAGKLTVEDIVHHELFHLLDLEVFSDLGRIDAAWRALNPVGFVYRDPAASTDRPYGFTMAYGTTDEIEDRASVYAYLMARPGELCEMAATDAIVRDKARRIWARLAAIEGGAEMLEGRASCVDWIDPAAERATVARRDDAARSSTAHDRGPPVATGKYLSPPTPPHVLE